MENKYTIDYIKKDNLILFECVGGSHAYGTNTLTSDIDIRGVYIAELDDILSGKYPLQIADSTNNTTYYELGRFLELVRTNNPNILELLNSPEDCVKIKHQLFDDIIAHKDEFITKATKNSFGGYARQQIAKAKGLNKKQNWEKDKVTRKDLLDFCYVLKGEKSIRLSKWIVDHGMDVKFFGVTSVPNARDTYALFYDWDAHNCFSELVSEEEREKTKAKFNELGKTLGLGYKGLVKVGDSEEENPE